MFCIDKNNKIKLTRGDNVSILITIYDELGNEYSIADTDVIKLTLKKSPSANAAALAITASDDHYITFTHDDTKDLKTGNYVYDLELTNSLGEHYTIIPTSYFELAMEVSN